MIRRILVGTFAGVIVVACHQAPTELPLPKGTDALADSACANLRRVGCPEGFGSVGGASCTAVVLRASELRALPLECWTTAETSAAAKACGDLRCIR